MKRLILSSIPDDFDPQNDICLGTWCFIDKEEVYPGWESLKFQPDPFPTPEAKADASRLTSLYANSLLPTLRKQLNQENGTTSSEKFWRLLVMPWLLTLMVK